MSADEKGTVRISEDVVISLASSVINEIRGVEKIRSGYCSLKEFIINEKPVSVRIIGDVIEINADVVLKYGYNASAVAEKIQETVKSEIQSVTGIAVSRVNVKISGISFDK